MAWDDSPRARTIAVGRVEAGGVARLPCPVASRAFAREEEIDTLARMTRDLAELSSRPRRVTDNLYRGLAPARALAGWMEQAEALGNARDYDALEGRLLKLGRDLRRRDRARARANTAAARLARSCWRAATSCCDGSRSSACGRMPTWRRCCARKCAACSMNTRSASARRASWISWICCVAFAICFAINRMCAHYLQRPLHASVHRRISGYRSAASRRFCCCCGDDPRNRLAAGRSRGSCFWWAIPKQSIYKFRRADLVLYRQVRERLEERGVGLVTLDAELIVPFRNIQQFVNAAFETEMTGRCGRRARGWAPLGTRSRGDPGAAQRDRAAGAAPLQDPAREGGDQAQSLPDAIAAFVAWLVNDECAWGYRRTRHRRAVPRRRKLGKSI